MGMGMVFFSGDGYEYGNVIKIGNISYFIILIV